MSHPKIKNTITFTDEFGNDLKLSSSQIDEIDNLDYLFFRDYTFSNDPNYSATKERKRYYKAVLQILNVEQKIRFKTLRKEIKKKRKKTHDEIKETDLSRKHKKYGLLGLKDERLEQLMDILDVVKTLVHEESTQRISENRPKRNRHRRYLELANKKLEGFLGEKELKKFHQIEEEEENWLRNIHIDRIKHEYSELELSDEQANLIYDYEESEPTYDENSEYLSEFEKWGLEKEFMSTILDKKQEKAYLKLKKKQEDLYISHFEDTNHRKAQEIDGLQSKLVYLIENYLPILCERRKKLEEHIPEKLNQELTKLRSDYQESLEKILEKNLSDSIRHTKNYVPDEPLYLKLETQLNALIPRVHCLTEEQERFLAKVPQKLFALILKSDPTIEEVNARRNKFEIKNYEEHGGTYGGSTYVVRGHENQNSSKLSVLSMLLLNLRPKENILVMDRLK